MTLDEKRAYARGYNTRADQWPKHRPPRPPDEVVARLYDALVGLRDGFDELIATFGPDDEIVVALGPRVDAADAALCSLSAWLRTKDSP